MIIRTKTRIDIDFHAHILPFMDDGAADTAMSRDMLIMLAKQGVNRVAATSHFDSRNESVSDFLSRRADSMKKLCSDCNMEGLPRIILGAEVYCVEGISRIPLEPLCYEDTNYLLLEMPRLPYSDRLFAELEVIAYKQKLIPVIAHIDRYMDWYSDADMDKLLSFEDAVFQVNNHAFLKKNICRDVSEIIRCGYPVVLGSDAHDKYKRRPNFDLLDTVLEKHFYQKHIVPNIMDTIEKMRI